MIKKFFTYYLRRIRRYFEENTKSRLIVATLMIGAVLLLSFGIYYLTREGLLSTQQGNDPFMIKAVPLYIYQLFFLVTGFLIFVSSSIFGLFNFFKDDSDSWIMASKNFESLAWIKFLRALIDSSWPIIVLALPLLLAVQSVFSYPAWYFFLSLASIIIFSLFVSGLAITIIFLLSLLFKIIRIKSFKALAGTMGVICLLVGSLIWSRVVNIDIETLFQLDEAIDPSLAFLKENFSVFPSHLPAMTIFEGQSKSFSSGVNYLGFLTSLSLLVLLVFILLKEKFLNIWQSFQEGSFEAKTETNKKKRGKAIVNMPKTKKGVIFRKELLASLRSPKNLFWLSFLMILMLVQVGVVNLLEQYVGIGSSQHVAVAGLTPSLQIGVILFFISALILRFVFPALSQEGSTAWILGSAPIDFKEIFKVKYRFYGLLLSLIGLVALAVYIIPLSVTFQVAAVSIATILMGVSTLTMVGISLGSIFVNFETNDPQKLSTSPPGIGFILISLTYSGLGAYLVYEVFSRENHYLLLIFLFLSIIIYKGLKKAALKSLESLEFY